MKINNELKFSELSKEKDNLQNKVVPTIREVNEMAANELEKKLAENANETKLKIAFVGQYNAGKSTIISALTGRRDIKISSGVETDIATDYEWNNVLLTDTPGLKAGECEEHDRISLQKIKESDLLVFCITSSLFDDLIIADFIDLAYRQMYKSKIFLVINKMSDESGDFDTLVTNYKYSLNETIGKFGGNLNDFKLSFIDAKDFIEGTDTDDNDLLEFSHFNKFVDQLNNFIEKNDIAARLDTPCRFMEAAIADEIVNTRTELDKNMMSLLRQAESCVGKYRTDARTLLFNETNNLRNIVMDEAIKLIAVIGTEKVGENDCNNVNANIKRLVDNETLAFQSGLEKIQNDMFKEMADIWTSDMATFVINNINSGKINVHAGLVTDFTRFKETYKSISEYIKSGGKKVIGMAGEKTNIGGALGNLSNTELHNMVLKIGHHFGKSFKPWEALTIADKIGKIATKLGPALSVVSTIIDLGEVILNDVQNKKIQNAKEQTLVQFSELAADLVEQFKDAYFKLEKELFDTQINEISSARNKLIKANDDNNSYVSKLNDLRSEIDAFIAKLAEV